MRNIDKRKVGLKIEKYVISKLDFNDVSNKEFFDAYDNNGFIYEIKALMINSTEITKRFKINKEAHDKLLNYMSYYIFVLYEYIDEIITIKQIEKVDTKEVDIWLNGSIHGRVRPELLFNLNHNLSEIIN